MIYNGTSEPEQSIYYYVKRYFPDAVNRYIYSHDNFISKGVEVDIYIPSICVAIEYDGGFWHDNKKDNDALKNEFLNQNGIFVIRIRDINLPELPEFKGKVFYHGKAPKGMHKNECIESVLHELANHCCNELLVNQLHNFSLSFELYIKDLPDIISGMFPLKVKTNKSTFCGAEFWDNTANGRLKLKNIPAHSQGFYVNFKCKNGKYIHSTIDCLVDKKKCKKSNKLCSKCFNQVCLFSWNCNEFECPIILNYFNDYLSGNVECKIDIISDAYVNALSPNVICHFITKRLNCKNAETVERFNRLFYFPVFGVPRVKMVVTTLDELNILIAYAKQIGGLVLFDVSKLDNSDSCINTFGEYLTVVFNVIHKYNTEREHLGACRNYLYSIYKYWKEHNSEMQSAVQKLIHNFLKAVNNNFTDYQFKLD